MNPLISRLLIAAIALGVFAAVGWVFLRPEPSSAPARKEIEPLAFSGAATIKSAPAPQPYPSTNQPRPKREEKASLPKEDGGEPLPTASEQAAEVELAPGTRAPAVFLHENRETLTNRQSQALDEIVNELFDAVQRTPDEQLDEVFDRSAERADNDYSRIFGESESMQRGMEAAIEAKISESTPEAGR